MAKIENVITRKDDDFDFFDFDCLTSFQTKHYIGEWFYHIQGYLIFDKSEMVDFSSGIGVVQANSLEKLMQEVKYQVGEEITDVYAKHKIHLSVDEEF